MTHASTCKSAVSMERGDKKLSIQAMFNDRQHGFHILESGWGSHLPEIARTLCEFNTCSLQGSQKDANKETD